MVVRDCRAVEVSNLHLPRVLCLHGGGTNARIFQTQCRALERLLRSEFRLVYAEAPFRSEAGPDVVSVYKEFGPFKAWLRWRPEDPDLDAQNAVNFIRGSLSAAIAEDDRKGGTGEWAALLGFSQGAKICASLLFMQQVQNGGPRGLPCFHFAVLLAGRGPLVWLAPERDVPMGLVSAASLSTSRHEPLFVPTENILRVPTIHVHGVGDPGLELHREMLDWYCDPDSVTLIEWDGDHRVPIKTKDAGAVVEQINSVARMTGYPWIPVELGKLHPS